MRIVLAAAAVTALATGAMAQTTLGDRRAPDGYPTMASVPDQAGPLDGAAPAEALDAAQDDRVAALMGVLAPRGCRVAEREMAQVLAPEGFSYDFASQTITQLYIEGVAALDSQGYMSFPAELCPPSRDVATPRGQIVTAFRDQDCSLSERALREATPDLTDEDRLAIVEPWFADGRLTPTTALQAELDDSLCN